MRQSQHSTAKEVKRPIYKQERPRKGPEMGHFIIRYLGNSTYCTAVGTYLRYPITETNKTGITRQTNNHALELGVNPDNLENCLY